jgi:Phospholipase_D-nuclease N-terminal
MITKLLSLLWLIFLVILTTNIWNHPTLSQISKIIWIGVLFLLPGVGALLWLLIGRYVASPEEK